jgi:hypothetical protein
MLQVARDFGTHDGYVFDPWIAHLEEDRLAGHFANYLGDTSEAVGFHDSSALVGRP